MAFLSSEKRPKPVTVCTNCGTPGYNIQLANGKCERMVGKERCTGTNQSAIAENDWGECPWYGHRLGKERGVQSVLWFRLVVSPTLI
jgi:hypothetical protein